MLALLTIAYGCSEVDTSIGPELIVCSPLPPVYAISQHTMKYLPCFDPPYDERSAIHRGISSDTLIFTVTTNENNILLVTGHTPGTAQITVEATALGGTVQRQIAPVTTRLALETGVTRCDAEPIPGAEGATRLALDAWGKANADLHDVTVTGVAGGVTVLTSVMERMPFATRTEWSVSAAVGLIPHEAVLCLLTVDFEVRGDVPQIEGY
ncbi:MAG: hypothetical protein F4X47_11900 [Gammaproteobacteria bacterium]|nr:hypothetical protein [Gammaproteobacteria bacterium]MYC53008.1 hypothetical protein [Gammaproteobacteria bacterium]